MKRTVTHADLQKIIELGAEVCRKTNALAEAAKQAAETVIREEQRGNTEAATLFGLKAGNALIDEYVAVAQRYERAVFNLMGERARPEESPNDFFGRIASLDSLAILATMARNGISFRG